MYHTTIYKKTKQTSVPTQRGAHFYSFLQREALQKLNKRAHAGREAQTKTITTQHGSQFFHFYNDPNGK